MIGRRLRPSVRSLAEFAAGSADVLRGALPSGVGGLSEEHGSRAGAF
jgi:hypothetical protein